MTVIAFDGKTLASDSRSSCGSHIVSDRYQKIYTLPSIAYINDILLAIGVAGALADVDKVLYYLGGSEFPSNDVEYDVHAIIVGRAYTYMLEPDSGYLLRYNKKDRLAVGSGGLFANSAMLLGLGAKAAVKHAIKLDAGCGGRVQSWERK